MPGGDLLLGRLDLHPGVRSQGQESRAGGRAEVWAREAAYETRRDVNVGEERDPQLLPPALHSESMC